MRKLVFGDIEVIKKQFYGSKTTINLNVVGINKIVLSNKIKGNNEISKFFIGYLDNIGGIITPLYIILLQMSRYIKYFDGGGKNMSFKIDNDSVHIKYNQTWNKIKELLHIKFYTEPVYDGS